jgi:hypothetical protein
MANKFPAWCPGCTSVDVGEASSPCIHCGNPSFWPHAYPNCYVAAEVQPKPTAEEVTAEAFNDEVFKEMDRIVAEAEEDLDKEPEEEEELQESSTANFITSTWATPPPPVPESELAPMEDEPEEEFYFCSECNHRHRRDSGIGKEHLEYAE